jgi:hypothetical protein
MNPKIDVTEKEWKNLEFGRKENQGLGQALWDRSRALLQVGLYQLVDTHERFVTCSTVCFDCQVLQLQCICALKLYRFNGLPNACLYHSFIDINGATRPPDEIMSTNVGVAVGLFWNTSRHHTFICMRKFQQNTWILSAVYTVEKKNNGCLCVTGWFTLRTWLMSFKSVSHLIY